MTEQKQKRRKFSKEFKQEALLLADRLGAKRAAEELKIDSAQIYAWRSQVKNQSDKKADYEAEREENRRLKKLLQEREEELAILKKAAAYFAKHTK